MSGALYIPSVLICSLESATAATGACVLVAFSILVAVMLCYGGPDS